MVIENIMNRLTSLQGYTAIKKIDKGYSSDTKYVVTVDDTHYFVRLSDLAHHDKRWIEFTLLQDLELQGVQTHKAIEYMVLPDKDLSAMVMTYLIGTLADEIIPHLSDTEQFHLGLAAGKE
nr:phosphotransferase [Lysinibacillus fusiformis]